MLVSPFGKVLTWNPGNPLQTSTRFWFLFALRSYDADPQGSLKTGQSGSLQNRPTVRARDIDVDGSPYRLSRHEQRLERRKETASHRTGKARLVFTKDRARNRCTA